MVAVIELDLWLHGALAARAVPMRAGRRIVIDYTDEGRAGYRGGAPILSCSLPSMNGPCPPAASRAFLEGLLPEGAALTAAASRLRGVGLDLSGAPETAWDAAALLAEYGRECAGAVVVVPAGDGPPHHGRPSEPLTDRDLTDLINGLPAAPLGSDPAREIRLSLAGAQPKLLLTRVEGRWCRPLDGYPSTHIFKPETVWPHAARNENLVLRLARDFGLSDNPAWVEQVGGRDVLIVQRYDRMTDPDGVIRRVHQEDMCQAAGLRPMDKYLIGNPGQRMAKVLREFADDPIRELTALYRQVAFRALIGDEDGHGKNYSLLLDGGDVRVAPLYDSLCTLEYAELSGKMATRIGSQSSLATVDRSALLDEAAAMGLRRSDAAHVLDSLTSAVRAGIGDLPTVFTEGWPSEHLLETVLSRSARLDAGQPLGGTDRPVHRQRTLDAVTAARARPAGAARMRAASRVEPASGSGYGTTARGCAPHNDPGIGL